MAPLPYHLQINHSPITGAAANIIGVTLAELSLALIFIALRVYSSIRGISKIRYDFWFVVVGTCGGIATEGLMIMACKNGVGKHVQYVSALEQEPQALRWSEFAICTGFVSAFVAKLGVVALLYNVAAPHQWKRKVFLLTIGGLNIAICIVEVVLSLTQCTPIAHDWYFLMAGTCNGTTVAEHFGIFQGVFAVMVDLILAAYPITIVWSLQASFRVKLGFCMLMAGGCFGAIGAALRTYYITQLHAHFDATWDLGDYLVWSSTELWLVVILACVPPLRPLFLTWINKSTSLATGSASRHNATTMHSTVVAMRDVDPMTKNNMHKVSASAVASESEEAILQHLQRDHRIMVSQSYTIQTDH